MNQLQIFFDGGCRPTNPGNKYGSWEVVLNGQSVYAVRQIQFGRGTNNEAEFDSLIAALDWTMRHLNAGGFEAVDFDLRVVTDSTILVNRLNRRNRANKTEAQQRMNRLTQVCLSMMDRFRKVKISWERRDNNVKRFGH